MITKKFVVEAPHSAIKIGSGGLEVLSTPMLIAYVENTCFEYTTQKLTDSLTTVGTRIDVTHVKATKIGTIVEVRLLTIETNEKRFLFEFEVLENSQIIGKGYHKRAIVKADQFMQNL